MKHTCNQCGKVWITKVEKKAYYCSKSCFDRAKINTRQNDYTDTFKFHLTRAKIKHDQEQNSELAPEPPESPEEKLAAYKQKSMIENPEFLEVD
jgi:hypothetical protein